MAARACPYCRELNSPGEKRCYRCKRRLPGPFLEGVLRLYRDALGVEAPMMRLIVGLEVLAFGLCAIFDRRLPIEFFGSGFSPRALITFGALGGQFGAHEPWRLLSAVFVHMGVFHVGMNMLTLVNLGRPLEQALGSARFCLVFVLSGILGFLASEVWYGWSGPLTAGASGGVFGAIGAIVGVLYARRDPAWKKALTRYLVFALLLGVALPVNTPAHLGGFFAGIALAFGLQKEAITLRLHRTMAVLAFLSLVASVASVALSVASPASRAMRERAAAGE